MGLVKTPKRPGEIEEEKRQQLREKLHEKRKEYVIALLVKNNIDLDSFLKTHFYNNPNNYALIEHIYGKIKGYDFSNTMKEYFNEKGYRYFRFEEVNTPNGYVMDLDTLRIEFINNSLIISEQNVSYKYEVDEHCLIYLNGANLHIAEKILTEDEIRNSQQQLYDDLKSYRLRRQSAEIGSIEFAKTFHVR